MCVFDILICVPMCVYIYILSWPPLGQAHGDHHSDCQEALLQGTRPHQHNWNAQGAMRAAEAKIPSARRSFPTANGYELWQRRFSFAIGYHSFSHTIRIHQPVGIRLFPHHMNYHVCDGAFCMPSDMKGHVFQNRTFGRMPPPTSNALFIPHTNEAIAKVGDLMLDTSRCKFVRIYSLRLARILFRLLVHDSHLSC